MHGPHSYRPLKCQIPMRKHVSKDLQVQTKRKLIVHPLIGALGERPFTEPEAAHVHRQLNYSTVRRLLPTLPSGCSDWNMWSEPSLVHACMRIVAPAGCQPASTKIDT